MLSGRKMYVNRVLRAKIRVSAGTGTIEEKVVGLHLQKRGLADSLLEESDMSGKVSAEELLELLRKEL